MGLREAMGCTETRLTLSTIEVGKCEFATAVGGGAALLGLLWNCGCASIKVQGWCETGMRLRRKYRSAGGGRSIHRVRIAHSPLYRVRQVLRRGLCACNSERGSE